MMKVALTKMKSALVKTGLRRATCLAVVLAAWAAAAPSVARATTLAEYRRNVRAASASLDRLASLCERLAEGERAEVRARGGADAGLPAEEKRALAEARRLVPPQERVEWAGEVTVADNAWLHAALQEYEERSPRMGNAERAAAVRQTVARLGALEARLAEAEDAGGASAPDRDKDAEKGRLATILRGPDFNQKASEGGALQRLLEQFVEWVRSLIPGLRPLRPATDARLSVAAQVLIFGLALAVVGFLVWKYWWRGRSGLGGLRARGRAARVVLGERIAPDETAADLLAEAERLARAGDLRGAIRKAYVALLCELGDRKVIRLAQHKTNRDYLRAVRAAAPPLSNAMMFLTDSFERHWYGLEAATELDWDDFRTRCRQTLSVK